MMCVYCLVYQIILEFLTEVNMHQYASPIPTENNKITY